jgi:hypothetical protein
LVVEREHLKIKTRLTNEKFASVKGEKNIGTSSFKLHSNATWTKVFGMNPKSYAIMSTTD